jgi:hypothetical protein
MTERFRSPPRRIGSFERSRQVKKTSSRKSLRLLLNQRCLVMSRRYSRLDGGERSEFAKPTLKEVYDRWAK